MEAKDYLGNVIAEGDTIVYATKGSSNARLSKGVVKRIYDSEESTFVWSSGKYQTSKIKKLSVEVGGKLVTLSKMDRVVVVKPGKDEILREHLSEYGKFVFDSKSGE